MFKKKKVLFPLILLVLILSGILFLPVINSTSHYLSRTSRVKANILLVEGWLLPNAIEMAEDEFKNNSYDYIVTTGIRISGYFQVSMNGYLIFYTHGKLKGINTTGDHHIAIDAYSEMDKENCAHFKVFVNDSVISDFNAGKRKKLYEIIWKGRPEKIDSVTVQFDNDRFEDHIDRNLYVKEIVFDHRIHLPYQYNSAYDIGEPDGKRRINNNFNSHAELARNALISLGIDSSLILAIPGKRVRLNRTLSSALAFRDWLKTSKIDVKGINIVTRGTHARRTLMTYNKILNKKYETGIISLPDYKEQSSRKYKILKTLRETIGLIYYWIILIPY